MISCAGADLFIEIMAIVEANYPETLKKTYIINGKEMVSRVNGYIHSLDEV